MLMFVFFHFVFLVHPEVAQVVAHQHLEVGLVYSTGLGVSFTSRARSPPQLANYKDRHTISLDFICLKFKLYFQLINFLIAMKLHPLQNISKDQLKRVALQNISCRLKQMTIKYYIT